MFYKIKKIEALENQILKIYFVNGKIKYYNIRNAIKKVKELEPLKNQMLFQNVKVDIGGYAAIWSDELDIDCNELYINGEDNLKEENEPK